MTNPQAGEPPGGDPTWGSPERQGLASWAHGQGAQGHPCQGSLRHRGGGRGPAPHRHSDLSGQNWSEMRELTREGDKQGNAWWGNARRINVDWGHEEAGGSRNWASLALARGSRGCSHGEGEVSPAQEQRAAADTPGGPQEILLWDKNWIMKSASNN